MYHMILTTYAAICRALRQLGFNETYHMENTYSNPGDADLWLEALNAKASGEGVFGKEQWDQLLGHCQVKQYCFYRRCHAYRFIEC